MTTGFIYDERCLAHVNPTMLVTPSVHELFPVVHFERPERMLRTYELLERAGVLESLVRIAPREATEAELTLAHSQAHVDRVRAACAGSGEDIGLFAWAGPDSWQPALLSAGGVLEAIDAVLGRAVSNAYVLLRPPGHHATAEEPIGFCLFNNVAIGARYARQHHGLDRVAIVDWDVHHGNGTQAILYDDPTVLFVSLHQDGLFPPDSGGLDETGGGAGKGFTVNVPLPPGTTDAGYEAAVDRVVVPVVRAFSPDLLLVSAGQDPSAADPLGRMSVTSQGFRSLARKLLALADEVCGGRLVVVQEGGYSVDYMPFCNLAIVEMLAGLEPHFPDDPFGLQTELSVRDEERAAVERAVAGHADSWPLR